MRMVGKTLRLRKQKDVKKGGGNCGDGDAGIQTGNQRWITGRSCQPAFAQIEFSLEIAVHVISDSSV